MFLKLADGDIGGKLGGELTATYNSSNVIPSVLIKIYLQAGLNVKLS